MMKQLFVTLCKMLGLFQVYELVGALSQFGHSWAWFGRAPGSQGHSPLGWMVSSLLYFGASVGMTWLLLLRTEWLAEKLGIEGDKDTKGPDRYHHLLVGVRLIGVYAIVFAAPVLAVTVIDSFTSSAGSFAGYHWREFTRSGLQLAFGLALTLKAAQVVAMIAKDTHRTEKAHTGDGGPSAR